MKYLDLDGLTTFWENAYQKIDDLITTKISECSNFDSSGTYPNLTAGKATKLATARKIGLTGGAVGTATNFDGSAAINIPVTSLNDTHVVYKKLTDINTESPYLTLIDAVSGQFTANRLAFKKPENILIEYSNDNGASWNTSTHTDETKVNLVSGIDAYLYLGNKTTGQTNQDKLRITILAGEKQDFYSAWQRLYIYLATNGAYAKGEHGLWCTYEYSLNKTPDVWVSKGEWFMTGWAGWNKLPAPVSAFGNNSNVNHPYAIRLTFRFEGHADGYENTTRACIRKIELRGDTVHSNYTGCKLAETGHMYGYDWQKNVTFPNAVKGKKLITDGGKSTQVVKGDGSLEEESALAVASAIDAEHAEEADYAGVADKADKLTTARTIALSEGVVSASISFDGSKNISIPVRELSDLHLKRTYNNNGRADFLSLVDLASPLFASNRLAFNNPNGILIYKSNDGGATWVGYGATDEQKTKFVSGINQPIYIGGKTTGQVAVQDRLRIVLTANRNAYTSIEEFLLYVTTSGAESCQCRLSYVTVAQFDATLDYNSQTYTEITTKQVVGWSGWNRLLQTYSYAFGYDSADNVKAFIFEFWFERARSGYEDRIGFYLSQLVGIGQSMYSNRTGTDMMNNGNLYTYDWQKNAIFPATVTATKHITQGGTSNQVVLGNGELAKIDELGVGMALESEHAIEADYAETAEKLANARTISLSGGASGSVSFDGSKNVVLPLDYLSTDVKFNTRLDTNRVLYPEYDRLISNPLAKYSWHDILAFNTNGWATFERSADGITWEESTNISDRRKPFIHMEKSNYVNVIDSTHKASRWTWNNSDFHYCQAFYLYIGYSWVSVASAFTLQIEIKNREGVWELRKTIDSNGISGSVRLYLISDIAWAEAEGLRITFIKAEDEVEGARLGVTMIKLLSYRSGDQGQGGEKEKPYRWDEYLSLIPRTGLESNIGDTGAYWKNVYAQKFIAYGGTNQQVICADGSKKLISELSPITDADAEILLDNHIHSINVNANGNDVNISVIESSKQGNAWETEDNDITIPLATTTSAGVMSKEDKQKIDAINYDDNTLYVGDGNDGMLTIGYESSKASADLRVMRDRYATIHTTSYNDTTGGSIAVMEANGGTGRMEVNGDKLAELVLSGMDTVRATLTKENEDGTSVETIIDAEEGITAPKFATIGGTSEQILLGDGSLKDLSEISPITVWDGTGMPSLISDFYDSVDMYAFFNLNEYGLKHGGLYIVEAEETFENDAYSQCAMMFVYRSGQNSIVLSSTKDGDLEFELAGNEVYIYGSAGNGTFTLREVLSTNLNI